MNKCYCFSGLHNYTTILGYALYYNLIATFAIGDVSFNTVCSDNNNNNENLLMFSIIVWRIDMLCRSSLYATHLIKCNRKAEF